MTSSELRLIILNKISIALESCPTGEPSTTWPAWWGEGVVIIAILSNRRVLVPLPANTIFRTMSAARHPHVRYAYPALNIEGGAMSAEKEKNLRMEGPQGWWGRGITLGRKGAFNFYPSKNCTNAFLSHIPLSLSHLWVKVRKQLKIGLPRLWKLDDQTV